MINRVTENIKFNMITNNLFNVASKYGELMEQLSTQKMINRPSDNPIGTNDILDFRTAITSVQQFKTNIVDANVWLTLTSTNLSGLRNIVDAAKDIAISESGAGGSPETRQASVATLTSLIDEAVTLLNAKNGDNYMFGGSSTDVQPFSSTYSPASVSAVSAATTNAFNGAVTSGGVYTGTENNNYALRIVAGGPLAAATYQISADGGKNWGGVQTDLSAGVSLGDGVSLSFTAGTEDLAAGDLFTVNGNAAGYYRGNNDKLNAVIGKNNTLAYNITGAEAFTGPIAQAAVIGVGAGLTADDTILLTRGATAGSWVLTSRPNYPAMVITSQTADAVTIDADNDGTNDVTLSLSGPWSENNTATFSIETGSPSTLSPVNVSGPGSVDLLTTLNALKAALSEPDQGRAQDLIAAQVDNLKNAEMQMLQYETQAGAKMNSLKMTGANHDSFKLQITNMLADTENADLTKLITEFQMKQIAMQASYSMASQIGKMTILDYI